VQRSSSASLDVHLRNPDGASLTAAELAALEQDDSGSVTFVDVIDLVFQL
jgi:hypothetical protein